VNSSSLFFGGSLIAALIAGAVAVRYVLHRGHVAVLLRTALQNRRKLVA